MNVVSSGKGTRNDTLNKAAFSLGQLIAGGALSESEAENGLIGAASSIGLTVKEARATINSGFKSGKQHPRNAPERESDDYYFVSDVSDVSNVNPCKQDVSKTGENVSRCKQMSADVSRCKQDSKAKAPDNIMGHIKEFIENSRGYFTTKDLDFELGLKDRREKNARSRALNYMESNQLIYKDKVVSGKWHICDNSLDFVDLDAPAEESFPIKLPFEIHKRVVISPRSIILLAGSSNAGKTALALNILHNNINQNYEKLYLMSEMGRGEYVSRIKKIGDIDDWRNVKAAERSYDFSSAITHHNKDGLTVIDYLEEVEGEFFKIPTHIRDIYDSLKEGVCVVCIQKKKNAEFARGGEGTREKARLIMLVDFLAVGKKSIICSLKLDKVKHFIYKDMKYIFGCLRVTKSNH